MAMSVVTSRVELPVRVGADAVLGREGWTVSGAIREFLSYISRTNTLPDFMREGADDAKRRRRHEALRYFADNPIEETLDDETVRSIIDAERSVRFG